MNKWSVINAGQALAYITDCTLATVCSMAQKKSIIKSEYKRQMDIAQTAIYWMDQFGVDYSTTRAKDVKDSGSVVAWARKFEP